jgi:hypothetical protein
VKRGSDGWVGLVVGPNLLIASVAANLHTGFVWWCMHSNRDTDIDVNSSIWDTIDGWV